jgi:hypothetical protein
MVSVPNFVGMTFDQASTVAEQAGLVLIRDKFDQTSSQPANTIIGQDPASGATVDRGTEVKLTLAAPAAAVLVPDLRNQPWQTADTLIVQAGLAIGDRTDEFDPLVPLGLVVSQDPRPLLAVPPQTTINYVVSKGPQPSPTLSPTASPTPSPKPTLPPTAPPTQAPTPTPTKAPTPTPTPTASPPPDVSPSVSSHAPDASATGVSVASTISVTFSEQVTPHDGWYSISCEASGVHAAGVTGGPLTWTLTPTATFAPTEKCTVTVVGARVSDQDSNDPPDTMAADDAWSFKTGS